MFRRMNRTWRSTDLLFSLLVLGVLLCFTYGNLVKGPYAGFYFNPSDGQVLEVYVETKPADLIRNGDVIQQVGAISFAQYASDITQSFFEHMQRGDFVTILLERDGETLTVMWPFPGFNLREFRTRFFNIWWLGYIFWVFGLGTQLFVRPQDIRQKLLVAMNYSTAFWLVLGDMSSLRIWGSSLLLRAMTWLILPVYFHLHWNFPRPLGRAPRSAWAVLYLAGFTLAFMELLQRPPHSLYALGFLIALLGSILLLFAHFALHPAQRRDVGFLLLAILVATIPSMALSVVRTLGNIPQIGPLALFTMLAMPGGYFYVIYRRQLGGLEMRANRIISVYSYVILLGTVLLFLVLPATSLSLPPEALIFAAVFVSSATALISILVFPAYQSFLERRLLGISLPYQNLQGNYSTRIIDSASLSSLLGLLKNEVFPSLFVRQSALIHISNNSPKALLTEGLAEDQLPDKEDMDRLSSSMGRYLPSVSSDQQIALSWIRLVLPLKTGEGLIGLWLLGRRDPDDFYHQSEIPILQSLANQTAIALSNILQTDRLRFMYQDDINRYEADRLDLARDLHESILNQLAVLRTNIDDSLLTPRFQKAYDELVQRLREIVSNLRPPMLSYGLRLAIGGLADNSMERSGDKIAITVDLKGNDQRYSQNIELHLYRIVQEACENALRHAHATEITLSGELNPTRAVLQIADNGIGFEMGTHLDLEDLISKKHFGLKGIIERANLIGAELHIDSSPKTGTRIKVQWKVAE